MIWHLAEVWLILVATFFVGCLAGALLYDLAAGSRLAPVQGRIADSIGDVIDRIEDRFGLGPAWRPQYQRIVESVAASADVRPAEPAEQASSRSWDDEPEALADGEADIVEEAYDDAPIHDRNGTAWLEPPPPEGAGDEPDSAPGAVETGGIAPMRPASLAEPRNGVPDNLQRIRGIGERNEVRLNKLGVFHFGQIAAWTPAEIAWIAQQLAFPERIERDDWVGQATVLAGGGKTGFVKSAERRRARRHQESLEAEGANGGADEPS